MQNAHQQPHEMVAHLNTATDEERVSERLNNLPKSHDL